MYEVLKHVLNVNNPSSNPVEANLQFFSVKYYSKKQQFSGQLFDCQHSAQW